MSVSKNSVVKSVLYPAMDWAVCGVLCVFRFFNNANSGHIVCDLVFFLAVVFSLMHGFLRGAVSIVCFRLLHQFSLLFPIVNRWLFAACDFIYAILNAISSLWAVGLPLIIVWCDCGGFHDLPF